MTKDFHIAQRFTTELHILEDLIAKAYRTHGALPAGLAHKIAQDLAKHVQRLLNRHLHAAQVQHDSASSHHEQLGRLLNAISPELLLSLKLDNVQLKHKIAMLALGHPELAHVSQPLPMEFDHASNEFCLRYYYMGAQPEFRVQVDSHALAPFAAKIRAHRFFDTTLFKEQIAWFSWARSGALRIEVNGKPVAAALPHAGQSSLSDAAGTADSLQTRHHPQEAQLLRMLARMPAYVRQFKQAWLFMDRDTQADDNAEHLYRYVRRRQPQVNAWFILRDTSHDWQRLEEEGFRLLRFGSLDHKLALLNADHLLSSHADPYVAQYLPIDYFSDLLKFQFTFLQHGVTQGDLSEWLNYRPIRHLITSASTERQSIVSDDTGYRYTTREAALTGMPRHDKLIRKRAIHRRPRRIVIMPTWRESVVGEALDMTNARRRNPQFRQTAFFKAWHGLLTEPRFLQMAQRHGHEIVLFPHANLQPYLDDFAGSQIKVLAHGDVASIQDLFLDTAALITDYSSVAFELAYLERPLLYYQFDINTIYRGGHFIRKGYFDYHEHGFGPVCATKSALLDELESLLEADGKPAEPYARRMKDFFAFRDGRCCERVYKLVAQTGVYDTYTEEPPAALPASLRNI
ncbi:CDP-glycerol glycerophosphotransferase family protein [Pusillimonas sp.]|uniref:CDP-glycerol glycerophosphotransferase family protein n=1 Tax=Pusillimonas sp. TaxID=3040095 RepID=UPI0037CC5DCA